MRLSNHCYWGLCIGERINDAGMAEFRQGLHVGKKSDERVRVARCQKRNTLRRGKAHFATERPAGIHEGFKLTDPSFRLFVDARGLPGGIWLDHYRGFPPGMAIGKRRYFLP